MEHETAVWKEMKGWRDGRERRERGEGEKREESNPRGQQKDSE